MGAPWTVPELYRLGWGGVMPERPTRRGGTFNHLTSMEGRQGETECNLVATDSINHTFKRKSH